MINGNEREGWGLMRRGYRDRLLFTHDGRNYFVYSIEELFTAQEG